MPAYADDRPLTLNGTLQRVYDGNPSIAAARHALSATEEEKVQARAGYLPRAGAEASIVSTDVEAGNFSSGDGATTKGGSVFIEQALFRGFRTQADVERADSVIAAERERFRQVSQEIFLSAAGAYMDVIRDRLLLDLRIKNRDVLEEQRNSVVARFEAGDLTRTDVRQTEARVSRAVADQAIAESALRRSEATFEEVTGDPPPYLMEMPAIAFTFPQTKDQLVMAAEAQNPQVLRSLREHQAARSDVKAANSDHYPQLVAFASHAREFDPQPGIVDKVESSAIGIRANISLYEGGATQSRVRAAKERASQRLADSARVRNAVIGGLVSDWKRYQALETEIAARELEAAAARFSADGVREEAKLGERTVFDALEAEQDVLDAETGLVLAQRERVVTGYSLAAALGLLTPERLGLEGKKPVEQVKVLPKIPTASKPTVYPAEDYARALIGME